MSNKKRAKNEPTKGDSLAQAYRNRAAMLRVFEAAIKGNRNVNSDLIQRQYWTPRDMDSFPRWEAKS